MAKKMLKCIKDVYMKNSHTKAFTKGKLYRPYQYSFFTDLETLVTTICAKNDQKQRHIIKEISPHPNDEFYKTHFEEVYL